MALRKSQGQAYFSDPTRETNFRSFFGLPDTETSLIDLNAVAGLKGSPEIYSGKLYLSNHFLSFTSSDRRSCKLSIPLSTVRRVEKLAPGNFGTGLGPLEKVGVGVYALSIELCQGSKLVVQLNGLRPTCDQFSSIFRTKLKDAMPAMKTLKPILSTFYSEKMSNETKGKEKEVNDLVDVGDGPDFTTTEGLTKGWHAGLTLKKTFNRGMVYKYPGDPRKLREKSKMKLWREYFEAHGRNLTLVRYPAFSRLVQVGLPNRVRGEIWECTSGSIHLRTRHPGEYRRILDEHQGKTSLSTDEIEKDLNRSLPEYPAYQAAGGIEALRRVLTSYSWLNPEVGYCQGLNLIVSAFLIYTSEEQCFWLLNVLCDRLLPGYYSPTMYGTLLDQKVFEHLVHRCLPIIHDHFVQVDVQLSVASLPWFMSLFISSMPMVFAFRIVDCFFLMGPRVLFQVGLAILKINGEELVEATDDGMFINTIKSYFASLGDSAHPQSNDPRLKQVTKFQVLLVTAFREFGIITDETVASERKRFRTEIVESIETFVKRTAIRNLNSTGRLEKGQLSDLHDTFQLSVYKARAAAIPGRGARSPNVAMYKDEQDRPEVRVDRAAFPILLSELATWAREERVVKNALYERTVRDIAPDHDFIQRIFSYWDVQCRGSLSFQDVVSGVDGALFNDLMSSIAWMFDVHDSNKDGYLSKEEFLQLSEALLFIFRNEPGDQYLAAVSRLMQNAFEYAESISEGDANQTEREPGTVSDHKSERRRSGSVVESNPHRPYVSLATLRMVVLADEVLESFFESDFTNSWKIESQMVTTPSKPGFLGGLASAVGNFIGDEGKERLNRLADEVGKRLDMQTVEHRPAIGKFDGVTTVAFDSKHREPIVNVPSPGNSRSITASPMSAASIRQSAVSHSPPRDRTRLSPTSPKSRLMLPGANKLPERPTFVLDEAVGEDDTELESDARSVNHDDEQVMDEVEAFLAANGGSSNDDFTPAERDAAKKLLESAETGGGQDLLDL